MHKRRLNELTLTLTIAPDGPILIKSGQEAGADPTLPQMSFVRTRHPKTSARTIYLPGSSLKGVIRSHSERIIRTVFGDDADKCCDPLSRHQSCGVRHKNIQDTAEQYKALCLACKIFGHMVNAGHLLTADAYPEQPINGSPALEIRNNVAIDRLSGGVAVGPFDMEVAIQGAFETQLKLINFELWQVGLVALALRDLAEGRLPIGFAKSRGLGQVTATFQRLEIAYPGAFEMGDKAEVLYGVGALAPDLVAAYDYVADDQASYPTPGAPVAESAAWGRPAVAFEEHEAVTDVFKATVSAWAAKARAASDG
jgi:CRISPR/Cas system CSM-associated protein Csm3 (group 7 of RAMP superfamily)